MSMPRTSRVQTKPLENTHLLQLLLRHAETLLRVAQNPRGGQTNIHPTLSVSDRLPNLPDLLLCDNGGQKQRARCVGVHSPGRRHPHEYTRGGFLRVCDIDAVYCTSSRFGQGESTLEAQSTVRPSDYSDLVCKRELVFEKRRRSCSGAKVNTADVSTTQHTYAFANRPAGP